MQSQIHEIQMTIMYNDEFWKQEKMLKAFLGG